jgi:hypothetical protein
LTINPTAKYFAFVKITLNAPSFIHRVTWFD